MIRIQRVEGRESVVHGDREFTLVSWTWTLSVGRRGFGLGWRYDHPHRIESAGQSKTLPDYVFLARVAAAAMLVIATALQRRTHA